MDKRYYASCFVCYKPLHWAGGDGVVVKIADGKYSLDNQSSKNVNVKCVCGLYLAWWSFLNIWADNKRPLYVVG